MDPKNQCPGRPRSPGSASEQSGVDSRGEVESHETASEKTLVSTARSEVRPNDVMKEDARRYQPCYILHSVGIPCVVWFEDAVAYYGVPTCVFNLYVLVSDIDVAAGVLTQAGWAVVPPKRGFTNVFEGSVQRCLVSPRSTPTKTTTILLPAEEWNFSINQPETKKSFTAVIPPLATLLDALIDSLLDRHCDDSRLRMRLACLVCYLYDYVPELRKQEFAESLVYEHRQYHFDVLNGMSHGTLPFLRHQFQVRNALTTKRNNRASRVLCAQQQESLP